MGRRFQNVLYGMAFFVTATVLISAYGQASQSSQSPPANGGEGRGVDTLAQAQKQLSHALKANTKRMGLVSQNLSHARTTGNTPGADPYRRQIVTFKRKMDPSTGQKVVKVGSPIPDTKPFRKELNPSHPAADRTGHVKMPNVDPVIEMMDMQETTQATRRVLKAYKATTSMQHMMLNTLR